MNKHINKNRIEKYSAKPKAEYHFADESLQERMLSTVHAQIEVMNKVYITETGISRPSWDLANSISRMKKRITRFLGTYNKYVPHQGKREIARRKKQIDVGILQVSV